ncbi:MAG TPA: acyl-CoA dehydrogenase [Frankiaceae bacterium]|jgi:alkylation response protein AidB-like acyl-CoA dehydrogenase|nr:acyl-CoA dehydrogenase [Frankiaceae bacterium]
MARAGGVDVALSTLGTGEGASHDADEVQELREALRRALGNDRTAAPQIDTDWRSGWPAIAGLGVTALCVAEGAGGFGFRVDAAVGAAMELGAALHAAPFAGMTASAHAISQDSDAAGELLSLLLTGDQSCAYGQLRAGVARLVDGAAEADALVLADEAGGLILVRDRSDWDADPAHHSFDVSRRCADVRVKAGAGDPVHADASPALLHRLLLSADAVGGVQLMLDRTVDYAKQRQAFSKSIGGLQVVQHRLVEHAVRTRGMALLVNEAARQLGTGSPDAGRLVAMAEVSVSSGASRILHDLLQLTGAIGFTWEYGLHYFQRRAHSSARLAANPKAAIRALAGLEGWTDAG